MTDNEKRAKGDALLARLMRTRSLPVVVEPMPAPVSPHPPHPAQHERHRYH